MLIKSLEAEGKTEEELIKGWIRDYDPSRARLDQVFDDRRICLSWAASIQEGKKLFKRVDGEEKPITWQDCKDLLVKITKYLITKEATFNRPEIYKEGGARKLWAEVVKVIGEKNIPWKDKELTITSPDIPMEPVIATKKKFLTDSQIRELNDEELKSYHDQLHIIEKVKAEDLDVLAKNHALVVNELKRRKLKHDFDPDSKLDLKSKTYEQEYPKPWTELEKDLTLDEILEAFPDRIDLEGEAIQIFLVGRTVNTGICPKGHDIDVLFKADHLDPKVAKSFREQVAEKDPLIERKLHLILDSEGPLIGLAIPLYRSNEKVRRKEDELQKVKWGKPLGFMKPEKTCEFIHRFSSVWSDWAEERIKDGIFVSPKYDGLAFEVKKKGDKIWLITEDTEQDRASNLPDCVKEALTALKADEFIGHAELVWYKDEKFKEPHLRREMIRFANSPGEQDDSLVRFNMWDILWLDGKALWNLPWDEREKLLHKAIPKNTRHFYIQDGSVAWTKKDLRKLIFKYAVFPESEGAMLKTLDSKYKTNGTTRSREIAKFKNLKEIDTIVFGKHQVVREGMPQDTYNYYCFIGPLKEGEKDIFPEDELKSFKGKTYAHIGTSYNYGEKLPDGTVLTVAPVMATWEEVKGGKRKLGWMFPAVITHRPGKKDPDDLSFIKRVIAVGTKPLKIALELAGKEIYLYLIPCPYQDDEEKCVLKKRMGYKFGQIEEGELEEIEIYQQFLRYPIKCPWALVYWCPWVKNYYYGYALMGVI